MAEAPPLAKYLASTDKKTRDKAVKNLSQFLSDSSRDAIPKPEMAKLWKGIFYCFWMSDKPLVQQALANELAEIVLTIATTSASLAFLSGFWEAVVREWSGLDRLRMDKYYMLVRRFVNASFRLLMRAGWDTDACEEYNGILTRTGGPLCPDDNRVPGSLSYHIADIYLEELDKALSNPPIPDPLPAPLSTLLSPFFFIAARTPSAITYKRIQSSILDPMFIALNPSRAKEEDSSPQKKRLRLDEPTFENLVGNACMSDPGKEGVVGRGTLRGSLLRRMFEIASEQDTRDSNRRKLYAVWRSCREEDEEGEGGSDERLLDAS
ncbi:hypothetical protein JAAARDRAFT_65281 [Jaapia argillacea MUCL 33604]|uniref:Nop52-domain-containing protein n=1 Tax=Jaapia argillacea MUCL 33604 TaxID=933084 RepID=A0A067QI63_9AGAM|nr:hypothetical protein JAAARDRAFT_65281 [Jaapia argillacea MUCL 33604]